MRCPRVLLGLRVVLSVVIRHLRDLLVVLREDVLHLQVTVIVINFVLDDAWLFVRLLLESIHF
jgi:hypothetical protein